MNLHIVPDNVFINKFYDNLDELGLVSNNKIVVRNQGGELKYIKHPVMAAKLYSKKFNALVGDTMSYDKVFIHQFTPLLYRWVAKHRFKNLNWLSWGADVYNLPALDRICYEPETFAGYVKGGVSLQDRLYRLKVMLTQTPFEKNAYQKVDHLLTWMDSEFNFAKNHLPTLKASHQFFFYENQMPYQQLDTIVGEQVRSEKPLLIIGNSASHALNHLDAVRSLQSQQVVADLLIPISYGDKKYGTFLKKNLNFYTGGKITYQEDYLDFAGYLKLLSSADGLVMNNIRPQGYGNIFMMMYLGKKVYLNPKNISLPDLDEHQLKWISIEAVASTLMQPGPENKVGVRNLLSHERVLEIYPKYFA